MSKKTTNKITNTAELAQACASDMAAEMPANIDAGQVDAASVDGGENTQSATIDGVENVDGENTQSATVDAAQINFKKLKMRGLPKGITLDSAAIITGAIKAVLSGKPNNVDKPFTGFTVEEFRAFMGNDNYQNAAVHCIIHNYNGKNRCFSAFTYILDRPFNFVCTMHATKILPELQADKTLSGDQLYGYNERITKAMRVANEDEKSLIGTLSFNHLVEKGFGVDCAFISRADCNWAKKNIPALYALNEDFDVAKLPDNTINVDYRDVNALFDYITYLHLILKDADKEHTQGQKDAAKALLAKIGA